MSPWQFKVVGVEKITDGDTYWLRLDVGFRQTQLTHLRLLDYDTPELFRPQSDYERGEARRAKEVVEEWFLFINDPSTTVVVRTENDPDSFGRWLGEFTAHKEDGELHVNGHLGRHLSNLMLASEWPLRWREVFDEA